MALPGRPPSTAMGFSLDPQRPTSTSAPDAPTENVSQALSQHNDQAPFTTPNHNESSTMCGPVIDSSPLSSPISPSPPGAWPLKKTCFNFSKEAPTNDSKVPPSPGSIKSATSNISKKRSHAELDDEAMPSPKTAAKQSKPAQQSTRPSRNRKAPARFQDIKETQKKKAAAPTRKPASRVFDPVYITTNANSRLGKADVYHMLLKDDPWKCLTADQKLTLISILPKTPSNTKLQMDIAAGTATDNARPREFSANFNLFRTDVAKYLEDLTNGHLGKSWQATAEQAVVERAEGAYDDWKAEEAEAWWGQK